MAAFRSLKLGYVWGGTTGFTMNGSPWWGQLEDGLYVSGGCNGAGISKGTLLGKRLAELIVEEGDHTSLTGAFGHTKIESTVRYLGVDVEDALSLSERTKV